MGAFCRLKFRLYIFFFQTFFFFFNFPGGSDRSPLLPPAGAHAQILVCLVNLMGSLQINKAKHIVINMVSHMELYPLACMPIRTVVPLVISRAHYVVVRPPTNSPTNMTLIIVACIYLQCRSSLEDIRADVAE